MAAAGPAAGPSTSERGFIDVYSDMIENDEDLDRIAEANDLFDAVLTGSVDQDRRGSSKVAPSKEPSAQKKEISTAVQSQQGGHSLKLSLYIGHFPWWTSDTDILNIAHKLGVRDITKIKFAENKLNGQSRGYAEMEVTSQESFKILLEKIPQCTVNGERIDCRFATYQNLAVFEDTANKRIPLRVNSKDPKECDYSDKIPTLLSSQKSSPPPPIPPHFPSHPLANRFPSLPGPYPSHPPPHFLHMPPNLPPPLPPPMFHPHPVHIPIQPSPSLHINPAFFNPAQDSHHSNAYGKPNPKPPGTEGDFEELINRNRAVASSAITKAVSGATAGDFRVAMETLLTAIAIIKQSRVYGDERCQALVTSLKDCLVSIQGNYGCRSGSRSGDEEKVRERGRDRERERTRDRERERGRERNGERDRLRDGERERLREGDRERLRDGDRERLRDRERDREDSTAWENVGMSRRRREPSSSGDRDKERSRERERHRGHRDRYH